jgi:hypothetical protein
MSITAALFAAASILAGATIGLACRVKTDRALWLKRLRNLRESQRKLDHRKAFFRKPSDNGAAFLPLIELLTCLGFGIFFLALLLGFCH